jgi:hypothetical protein
MRIIGNKLGEFQERLTLSQLEANHSLIFLVCLVIIRCIWVNIVMIYINSWVKYERTTTSRWVSKKDNNSITSARGLVLYITFRLRKSFLNLAKIIIRLWIMAWLCFYFLLELAVTYWDYMCLYILAMALRPFYISFLIFII